MGPDRGPSRALLIGGAMGLVAAIGAWAAVAIGTATVFEVGPNLGSPFENYRFIASSSRFSAEVVGVLTIWLTYRDARGMALRPTRLSVRGLMGITGAIGLASARFSALFGAWLE
ncbi:hypothetical protein ElP_57610 [Tautonia plasticadhaerens]|uniref:Uncharacterized protein n=1 Tax=Tautonia plasticadhaerens TaxID=2527974 RepID=A0A518HAD6_9BACT|nr:hypothetical protein ElP_57610 [Tautonia plasticadhaerens]